MLVGYNWGPDNLRRLFEAGGQWSQIPERPRQYALRIMQNSPAAASRHQPNLEIVVIPVINAAEVEAARIE